MFESLRPQPADKILQLMQLYKDDPRGDKIDLGVGVYKDATGLTPVMRAISATLMPRSGEPRTNTRPSSTVRSSALASIT